MNKSPQSLFTRRSALVAAAAAAACGLAAQAPDSNHPTTRECIWIRSVDGQFCCGMVHRPLEIRGKCPALLIVHGLVGSKDQPHRIFVTLADELAKAGYISLRFDLLGRGDSEGSSIDATPARDLENARNALAALRQLKDVDPQDITVLGMSWGGTLASYLAGESTAVKNVVLWSSCPTDNETWSPAMKEVDGKSASDMFGNLLSKDFFEGVADLTPFSQLKKNRQAVLMVYGTKDEVIRQAKYETCKDELTFGDVNVKAVTIENADHALTSHDFERQTIEKTIEWLKQQP